MYYEIAVSIFGSIYLAIGVFLIFRRNDPNVSKNSPWLLNISHWSNCFELILVLPTATEIVTNEENFEYWWQLRDSGILICHFLIFFSYLLRGYRLYTIFKISFINDFSEHLYKTSQKWLIQFLLLLLFPFIMLAAIIIFLPEVGAYFPISESGNSYETRMAASCIYITLTFIEQLVLISLVYWLRLIDDKYNMNNELVWITCFWFISPLFSTFINSNRRVWLTSIVIRNLLLMIRSSLIPIIKSFKNSKFEEPLTLDMLNSLEIILENIKTLKHFEKFLKRNEGGLLILEFYQKCVC